MLKITRPFSSRAMGMMSAAAKSPYAATGFSPIISAQRNFSSQNKSFFDQRMIQHYVYGNHLGVLSKESFSKDQYKYAFKCLPDALSIKPTLTSADLTFIESCLNNISNADITEQLKTFIVNGKIDSEYFQLLLGKISSNEGFLKELLNLAVDQKNVAAIETVLNAPSSEKIKKRLASELNTKACNLSPKLEDGNSDLIESLFPKLTEKSQLRILKQCVAQKNMSLFENLSSKFSGNLPKEELMTLAKASGNVKTTLTIARELNAHTPPTELVLKQVAEETPKSTAEHLQDAFSLAKEKLLEAPEKMSDLKGIVKTLISQAFEKEPTEEVALSLPDTTFDYMQAAMDTVNRKKNECIDTMASLIERVVLASTSHKSNPASQVENAIPSEVATSIPLASLARVDLSRVRELQYFAPKPQPSQLAPFSTLATAERSKDPLVTGERKSVNFYSEISQRSPSEESDFYQMASLLALFLNVWNNTNDNEQKQEEVSFDRPQGQPSLSGSRVAPLMLKDISLSNIGLEAEQETEGQSEAVESPSEVVENTPKASVPFEAKVSDETKISQATKLVKNRTQRALASLALKVRSLFSRFMKFSKEIMKWVKNPNRFSNMPRAKKVWTNMSLYNLSEHLKPKSKKDFI